MSYFIAGYSTANLNLKSFEKVFSDVVPAHIKKEAYRIKGKKSFLVGFGNKKVIDDFIYHNERNGSWFSVVGSPLVSQSYRHDEQQFFDHFIANPQKILTQEIDGCFSLIAYNATTDSFFLATDYNNTIPIFYTRTSEGILVSSHELPLAKILQSDIDPLGFSMVVQVGKTWGPHTRFKNIRKLVACQLLTLQNESRDKENIYWHPSEEKLWSFSFNDAIEKWNSILKDSVQKYYECSKNETVVCDFTAGEDARLVLSQCHALGIPFKAQVSGFDDENDIDVVVSKKAAKEAGFDLIVRPKHFITEKQLLENENATYISLMHDAYEDFTRSCTDFASELVSPSLDYEYIKYNGGPGGEAYRGSYYLRGKALLPSLNISFDHRFFTRMKYLLDFHPGLLVYPDRDLKNIIFRLVEDSLADVKEFPIGIKIDHLLRMFQTCYSGLVYKNPFYLPLATRRMTHSIYSIPPHFKQGGKLTKACTEILYPKLAFTKNQNGVPTVRKTLLRTPLFIPEYIALAKFISKGFASRFFKWTQSNKWYYKWTDHAPAITGLMNNPPYSNWFSSSQSMITGNLYNRNAMNALLTDVKNGSTKYVPILGRIINQEIACRWVYNK